MFNVQNPFSLVEYSMSSPTHQKKGSQWLSELVAVDIFTLVWSSSQAASFCVRLVRMRLLNSSIFKVNLGPAVKPTN